MSKILLFSNNSFNISLILFFVILAFYLWYTFSIIYHLTRFGVGKKPKILALIFFIGSFILFTITLSTYSRVNWKEILQYFFKK